MANDHSSLIQAETWKPVVGFEGSYEVSDKGRVRSLDRTIVRSDGVLLPRKGKMLSLEIDRHGYPRARPSEGGKNKPHPVHKLVLAAFVGPREEGMECRHLDGNPKNNYVANLAYGTASQNTLDQVRHGTHYLASRKRCPRGHVLEYPNLVGKGKKLGYRACLACQRATSYMYLKPHLSGRLKEISDQYYEKIMDQDQAGHLGGAA